MPATQLTLCIWIAGGGAVGALSRYGTTLLCRQWMGAGFPWGTLVVNILGSFLLGLALFHPQGRPPVMAPWRMGLTVGLLGALTTFSTFSFESYELLILKQDYLRGGLNVGGNLILCFAAVAAGVAVAKSVLYG